jgi:hypothetical protein
VVNFDQTHPDALDRLHRKESGGEIMVLRKKDAPRKNDQHKEYARYAAHCLELVPAIPDQEYRSIQREMAAEWLRLADAIIHPQKPKVSNRARRRR